MSDERRDPRRDPTATSELTSEDAAFVRRLAEVYAPPPQTPSERVAFRAGLDRRLEHARRWGGSRAWLPALGTLAAAGLALVLALGGPGADRPATRAPAADTSPEDALLALASVGMDAVEEEEEALPDDYEAIASLFLGEV